VDRYRRLDAELERERGDARTHIAQLQERNQVGVIKLGSADHYLLALSLYQTPTLHSSFFHFVLHFFFLHSFFPFPYQESAVDAL
jgi:hypothetical protein